MTGCGPTRRAGPNALTPQVTGDCRLSGPGRPSYPVPPVAATETPRTSTGSTSTGSPTGSASDQEAAGPDIHRGFSISIMVSATRCLLTYIILPFVTPLLGIAPGVGPVLGLTLGTVAIGSNVLSIRRFWRADHPWKKYVTVLHVTVISMLLLLLYHDITKLAR